MVSKSTQTRTSESGKTVGAKRKAGGRRFQVGDRVRLTGDFLRATGQYAGGEGQSRWTVRECACGFCQRFTDYVSVDERKSDEELAYYAVEELAESPCNAYRRFHQGNLEKCR